ncbi:hypothetical protein [Thalassospira marina]|uniref:Uncharacterized protein n=1 Tax=Thalassospira marina TaxID=2048283 RepID=A0A2N3KVC7_9PROT|nr:hypothetical protein [Thalassospira marina]PKR54423.1 hypothetical protein COO20_09850 [Thalassospira marina]
MITIKCEHSVRRPRDGYAPPEHVITYEIMPIIFDDFEINGFPGASLKKCNSVAIAQAIAAHVIMDALIDCANILVNSRDRVTTTTTIDCITHSTEEDSKFSIINNGEFEGKVSVKTNETGSIDFRIFNVIVPRERLHEQPDAIMISEVCERLNKEIKRIGMECEFLKTAIDNHEQDVRKIAVDSPLPDSVLDRIR